MRNKFELLAEYIEHLKKFGKSSEETIEIYRKEIDDFIKFLPGEKILETTEGMGIEYIENLKKKFSVLSIKRKIASIRGFYKYLTKKYLVESDPFSEIKISQEKKDNSSKVTDGEIIRIMDYPKNDYKGKRDKIVIYLLFISGLKINDILSIKKENILGFSEINILRKNGIEKIKLDSLGVQILKNYLEAEEKNTIEDAKKNLFGDLTRQTFRARFIKYSKEAGLDIPISPIEIKKNAVEKKEKNISENNFFQEMKIEYMKIGIGDE